MNSTLNNVAETCKRREPETKPEQRPSFRSNGAPDLVTFYIGPQREIFIAHKQFVCYASPPLKAAFTSPLQEGQTQSFDISSTTPEVFDLWLHWIYQQHRVHGSALQLDMTLITSQNWNKEGLSHDERLEAFGLVTREFEKNVKLLVGLWGLAEYLMMSKLQNYALSELIEIVTQYRLRSSHNFQFPLHLLLDGIGSYVAGGARDQPLRKLFVDIIAVGLDFGPLSKRAELDECPADVLTDIISAIYRRFAIAGRSDYQPIVMCHYQVPEN